MMDEASLTAWQSNVHIPGSLLATWDHETGKEIPCMIIKDCDKTINPFGRKSRIRKITVMTKHGIQELSKYDIFPPGEARPSIPF